MKTYSVLEASTILEISTRAVQKRCKTDKVRKKDNKYLITQELIDNWHYKINSNELRTNQTNQTNEPVHSLKIAKLYDEIDNLKSKEKAYVERIDELIKKHEEEMLHRDKEIDDLVQSIEVSDIQELNLDDIEYYDFKFKREGEFPKEGNFVFVPKDMEYVEYGAGEHDSALEKLREWATLQNKIATNEELFEVKLRSATEIGDHYKNQYEYQRLHAEKILAMHERLIETVQIQSRDAFTRSVISGKEKGFDKNQPF